MPRYVLWHRHDPRECPIVFAAWRGFSSPLRHRPALASCLTGGHTVCWTVQATGAEQARHLLPPFLAERTDVLEVREITIP
jgi:hypothetical protein